MKNLIGTNSRSSSPAKRTRAEMEVTTDAEGEIEDVNMVPSGPSPTASDGSDQPANKKVSRLSQEARNAREASVDMMAEEKGSNLSENAYRTPQSGLSSSSSVTATSRTSDPSPSHHEPEKLPSMVDQVAKIIQISQTPLFDGLKGYVVCNRWLSDAQELATNAHKSSKDAQNDIVKPVDNRHLVDTSYSNLADDKGDKFYPLKPGLVVNQEIEIIPKEAWDLIVKWHGVHSDSPEIVRHCHNTNNNPGLESLQFELYPPVFTVMKLPDLSGGITFDTLKEKETTPVKIVSSRQDLFQSFLKRAKSAAGIEENRKVRVWRIIGTLTGGTAQPGMLTPAHSRSNSPAPHTLEPTDLGNKLVLDVNTFLGLQEGSQRELIDVKDETMNSNYNGHSNLDLVGLGMEGIIVLEEQIGGPAGGEWVSDNARANAAKNGFNRGLGFGNSLKPKSASASGRSSPVPGGMMTRGRAQRSGKTPGTVGLGNLGNSCYMNSALQCVRSVQELSFYFLSKSVPLHLDTI